ncbi:MAG: hypothetical protein JWO47_771 [Candidatus Saccharibacteria bacterium]|nr:hypothetical protein [Candidatus Saccharibacteria bacterium]
MAISNERRQAFENELDDVLGEATRHIRISEAEKQRIRERTFGLIKHFGKSDKPGDIASTLDPTSGDSDTLNGFGANRESSSHHAMQRALHHPVTDEGVIKPYIVSHVIGTRRQVAEADEPFRTTELTVPTPTQEHGEELSLQQDLAQKVSRDTAAALSLFLDGPHRQGM